eukprot:1001591-Rhodomonas_salina.1
MVGGEEGVDLDHYFQNAAVLSGEEVLGNVGSRGKEGRFRKSVGPKRLAEGVLCPVPRQGGYTAVDRAPRLQARRRVMCPTEDPLRDALG